MQRLFKKVLKKPGLPPGTLVHVGEKKTKEVTIRIIDYDEGNFQDKVVEKPEDCFTFKDQPNVTWINVEGIHQVDIIERIGIHFDLHPLILEDIVHTDQRPKIEDMEQNIFIIIKLLNYSETTNEVEAEQLSLVLGSNFVLSFHERYSDIFNPVIERIRNSKGRIRKVGSDYLVYALIDTVVDNYFIILEKIGERIESMEEELVTNPTPFTLQEIHSLKREMIFLRKSVWPLREVVSVLTRDESPLIKESTIIFLRDVYDHTIHVIDTIEIFRDMVSGMLDIYLSSLSNKMNDVMKVLTIIATIFIPLTFIAGIYGMNFKYMPELEWYWSYPAVWLVIIIVSVSMVIYFKRKEWL